VPERRGDARQKLVLRVTMGGVAHDSFVLGQLIVEAQRVIPDELGGGHGAIALEDRRMRDGPG
jgi:hypothetical protein